MVKRLTNLTGIEIYTEDGCRVGELEDIVIDPENGKILGILIPKPSKKFLKRTNLDTETKIMLPYAAIKSIGDIVLVKNVVLGVKS